MSTTPVTSIADAQKATTPSKQLAIPNDPSTMNAFANAQSFELAQRMGTMFSRSSLVPKTYQGPDGLSDCIIAMNMANRIGCDALMIMQNLYIVHGKPAWSGQFVIAAINQSGLFIEPLHFEFVGTEGQDDWGCYALGITKSGREIKGPTVTIGMAKAEGWLGKNPKWRNMPELMLRYRAGAFFGKTECPELLMGFKTADEVRDIIDFNPETGEVIVGEKVVTPASVGGATVEELTPYQRAEQSLADKEFEDSLPMGAGTPEQEEEAKRCNAEVEEKGFYTKEIDGEEYWVNAAGQVWDADHHGLSTSTGLPIVNKDGSFRAKRGTQTEDAQEPVQEAPEVSGANYGLD